MKKFILATVAPISSVFALTFALLLPFSAQATLINLSFDGLVDASGATVGGVAAPTGSAFSLNIVVDDALATSGIYSITDISYTTVVGTYNTISTSWNKDLVATQAGSSITLGQSGGFFEINTTTEHFGLSLGNFGVSSFDDIFSWSGASIVGDIIVRGVGGFSSADQLSGISPFQGTLSVSTVSDVPEPSIIALFGFGLAGMVFFRRKSARKS